MARHAQRRREAAEDAADQGDADREPERDRVDARLLEARHAVRAPGDDRGDERAREHETGRRRGEREHEALGQQLADDARLASAERGAYGDLARPRRAAREQQVGDVAAGDQQHQADRRQQRQQTLPDVADELLDERHRCEADGLVFFR